MIKILEYQPIHQPYFEKFNRAWIEELFEMEPLDIFVLTKPQEAIIDKGGSIIMASFDGKIAGTVALRNLGSGVFEFTKMAVEEKFRRRGIAEALSKEAFKKARLLNGSKIVLYTQSSMSGAVSLYEKLGFRHVPVDGVYKRADVKMELSLDDLQEEHLLPIRISVIVAAPSQATEIADIGRRAFRQAFGHLFNNAKNLQHYLEYTYSVDRIEDSLQKENNYFLLATVNGKAAGFAKVKRHSLNSQIDSVFQSELQKLYVLQDYHGRGVGDALMEEVKGMVTDWNQEYVWLDTLMTNARAIGFYKRHGFARHGKHYFTIGDQTFEYDVMKLPIEVPVHV